MPANFSFNLQRVLTKARRHGGTSVAGAATELPLPSVKVEGAGRLAFPLPPDQAEKLAKCAQQAPFGRGLETVVDTSVRNTLQIDPNHVDIESTPVWRSGFEQLVRRALDGLGTDPAFVEAKLYKLLLYQKGGHFDFHRDTEKERGMFATLVVQLPSHFSGGEFVVRHGGVEKTYTLGSDDSSCSQLSHFVAHYADCEHAVREVTGGHRLALVYSLCWKGEDGPPPTPAALSSTALGQRLANMFEEGFHANDVPTPLCVYLEHQYTEDSLGHLGIRALKGRDRAIADAFLAAGGVLAQKDRGNELSMCIASSSQVREEDCDENGSTIYVGLSNEDMDDRMDTKLKTVFELDGKVNKSLKDLGVDWTNWARSESFVLSDSHDSEVEDERKRRDEEDDRDSDRFDDYDSDDYDYYRFQRMSAWRMVRREKVNLTGNEGATKETTYACYILVVWPRKVYIDLLLQCGVQHAVHYVDGVSGTEAVAFLPRIVNYVASNLTRETASSCTLLLQVLVKFRQPQLMRDLLEIFATRPRICRLTTEVKTFLDAGSAGLFSIDIANAISDAALGLGLEHVLPAIEKLLAASRKHGGSQVEARLILAERLGLGMIHKMSALEDALSDLKSHGSVCKSALSLLLSVNDDERLQCFRNSVLACFAGKSREMLIDLDLSDKLCPLMEGINTVLAEQPPKEPGQSVFCGVRREVTQIRVRLFVEYVEAKSCNDLDIWEIICPDSDPPDSHILSESELTFFLETADASMLLRFQVAVLRWDVQKLKRLVRQINEIMAETTVTSEALSMLGEVKTRLIDLLQEATRLKPVYVNEMSDARYPYDPNIEKFLQGPRRTKRIALDGDIIDADRLASQIKDDCSGQSGISIQVSVGGTDGYSFITLKKTRRLHEREVRKYENNCRMLEELLKEREEAATMEIPCSEAETRTVDSSRGLSESAEPAAKLAKMDY